MKQIQAGGGVLYRIRESVPEVLLIKRNGIWDLPKGKLEENESIEQCSVREVAEEVGAVQPCIAAYLTTTYHEYMLDDLLIGKSTEWYSMILPDIESGSTLFPQNEEGISQLEWVPLDKAIRRVGFENLKTVLKKFAVRYHQIKKA